MEEIKSAKVTFPFGEKTISFASQSLTSHLVVVNRFAAR